MADICQKSANLLNIRSIQIDIFINSTEPANVYTLHSRTQIVCARRWMSVLTSSFGTVSFLSVHCKCLRSYYAIRALSFIICYCRSYDSNRVRALKCGIYNERNSRARLVRVFFLVALFACARGVCGIQF